MSGLIKSIGKVIKDIGRGISKLVKKIAPALILAAAVYAGVAVLGASSAGTLGKAMAGGSFNFGASNFMKGLGVIKEFALPSLTKQQFSTGQMVAGAYSGGDEGGEFNTGNPQKTLPQIISQGMSTGDALAYMTKMNIIGTGFKAVAGLFEETDAQVAEREHETRMERYKETGIPDMFKKGPIKSPLVEFQEMSMMRQPSEPTFGRGPSISGLGKQKTFDTSGPSAALFKEPGLITRGAQRRFA